MIGIMSLTQLCWAAPCVQIQFASTSHMYVSNLPATGNLLPPSVLVLCPQHLALVMRVCVRANTLLAGLIYGLVLRALVQWRPASHVAAKVTTSAAAATAAAANSSSSSATPRQKQQLSSAAAKPRWRQMLALACGAAAMAAAVHAQWQQQARGGSSSSSSSNSSMIDVAKAWAGFDHLRERAPPLPASWVAHASWVVQPWYRLSTCVDGAHESSCTQAGLAPMLMSLSHTTFACNIIFVVLRLFTAFASSGPVGALVTIVVCHWVTLFADMQKRAGLAQHPCMGVRTQRTRIQWRGGVAADLFGRGPCCNFKYNCEVQLIE